MRLAKCKIQAADKRTSTVTFTDAPDSMCQAGRTSMTRRHSRLVESPVEQREGLSTPAPGPSGHTDGQCCPLRSRLSRRRRASRGRTSWPSLLPCLPVIPVLCFPSRHRRGPSERPPGGVLRGNTGALMALLADQCFRRVYSLAGSLGLHPTVITNSTDYLFRLFRLVYSLRI